MHFVAYREFMRPVGQANGIKELIISLRDKFLMRINCDLHIKQCQCLLAVNSLLSNFQEVVVRPLSTSQRSLVAVPLFGVLAASLPMQCDFISNEQILDTYRIDPRLNEHLKRIYRKTVSLCGFSMRCDSIIYPRFLSHLVNARYFFQKFVKYRRHFFEIQWEEGGREGGARGGDDLSFILQ